MLKIKTFKPILISAVMAILLALIFTLYYVLIKVDVATESINKNLTPEILNKAYQPRPMVVLVSYADGPEVFFKNQNTLSWSALNKGIDVIMNYKRGHIDPQFYEKNKETLIQKGGSGYWLWKPYFIMKTMETFPDNTIILYADSGVIFTDPIEKILQIINQNQMLLVGHGKPVPLRHHLKAETQKIMGIESNEIILNSQNIWAFFMGIRNTPETRAFIKKWLTACENKDALATEPFDPKIQEKSFEYHQHDQSILSVLVAQDPKNKTVIKRDVLRREYGVTNFHRHAEQENTSPLFHMAGINREIADFLFNNFIFQWIRRVF